VFIFSYFTDTYNFYLFPRCYGLNTDSINSFQSSSVEFLCKYDFDFNKMTYKGISYMNNKQEKQLETRLKKYSFLFLLIECIDNNDI